MGISWRAPCVRSFVGGANRWLEDIRMNFDMIHTKPTYFYSTSTVLWWQRNCENNNINSNFTKEHTLDSSTSGSIINVIFIYLLKVNAFRHWNALDDSSRIKTKIMYKTTTISTPGAAAATAAAQIIYMNYMEISWIIFYARVLHPIQWQL